MRRLLLSVLALSVIVSFYSCRARTEAFTLTYYYSSGTQEAIGEHLRAALAECGIQLDTAECSRKQLDEYRDEGSFALMQSSVGSVINEPLVFLERFTSLSEENDAGLGKGAHASLAIYSVDLTPYGGELIKNGTWAQTYDVLIDTARKCADTEARYSALHDAEELLMSTGCIIPLYWHTEYNYVHRDANGFFNTPSCLKNLMYTDVGGKTDNLNVLISRSLSTFDPSLASSYNELTVVLHLFSGLSKYIIKDGEVSIVPDCAKELVSGAVGDDGKITYVYSLKDGMKWSNGDEVKASDFVNSWKRASSQSLGSDMRELFSVFDGYESGEINATADDRANTITIVTSAFARQINELLAMPAFFPVHSSAIDENNQMTELSSFIYNGAYTVERMNDDFSFTIIKNPAYHDAELVKMNKISFFCDDSTAVQPEHYISGAYHVALNLPPQLLREATQEQREQICERGLLATNYISWNVNAELLPDSGLTGGEKEAAQVKIRHAVSLLIDRNKIAEAISQVGATPAYSYVALGVTDADGVDFCQSANKDENNDYPGYYNTSPKAVKSNTDKAKRVLRKYYK